MTKRSHDWDTRLAGFVQERIASPFEWGKNDCCLFACDAVLAMTGTDLAAEFRGKYDSALSAAKLIKGYGGLADLVSKVAVDNSVPEIGTAFATSGDVVLVAADQGDTLGVVETGGHYVMVPGEKGLMGVPRANWKRAWKI